MLTARGGGARKKERTHAHKHQCGNYEGRVGEVEETTRGINGNGKIQLKKSNCPKAEKNEFLKTAKETHYVQRNKDEIDGIFLIGNNVSWKTIEQHL